MMRTARVSIINPPQPLTRAGRTRAGHTSCRQRFVVGQHFYTTLETTQGQIDGNFSQLQFKRYLPEVASVED